MPASPLFNEIQIRALCPNEHEHMCLDCDDTGYINLCVNIDDLLKHVTMDCMQVNLAWRNPTITE